MNDSHTIAAKLLEDGDFDPKDYMMGLPARYVLVWRGGGGGQNIDAYWGQTVDWTLDLRDAMKFTNQKDAREMRAATGFSEVLKIMPVY